MSIAPLATKLMQGCPPVRQSQPRLLLPVLSLRLFRNRRLRPILFLLPFLLMLSVQASAVPFAQLSDSSISLKAKPGQIQPGDMTIPVGQATNVVCGGTITMAGDGGYFSFPSNHIRIGKVDDFDPSAWAVVRKFTLPSKAAKQEWVRIWKKNKYEFKDEFWLPWTPKKVGDYEVQCSLDAGYVNGGTLVSSHEIQIGQPGYTNLVHKKTIHVTAPPPSKPPTITKLEPNHFPIGNQPVHVAVYATNLDMYADNHVTIGGIGASYDWTAPRYHYGEKYVIVYMPFEVLKKKGLYKVQITTRAGKSNTLELGVGEVPKPPLRQMKYQGLKVSRQPAGKLPKPPLSSMGHEGMSTLGHARSPANANLQLPPPNIKVLGETDHIDKTCADMHRLITYNVTVRNDGGPLAMHRWSLFVMEGGGADLSSGGFWVPPLAPHAQATVSIPVLVLKSHVSQLPGTHWLKLISLDNRTHKKSTTKLRLFTLSRGICQPKMHVVSPARMHMQPNQHPVRRMQLPAVQ